MAILGSNQPGNRFPMNATRDNAGQVNMGIPNRPNQASTPVVTNKVERGQRDSVLFGK